MFLCGSSFTLGGFNNYEEQKKGLRKDKRFNDVFNLEVDHK